MLAGTELRRVLSRDHPDLVPPTPEGRVTEDEWAALLGAEPSPATITALGAVIEALATSRTEAHDLRHGDHARQVLAEADSTPQERAEAQGLLRARHGPDAELALRRHRRGGTVG